MTPAAARDPAAPLAAETTAPPHAPRRGRIRRLLGPFYVTGVFWYRFPFWAIRHGLLSPRTFPFFVPLFSSFFFCLLRNVREGIAANLEVVLGPCRFWERQRRTYRTLETFAWCYGARYDQLLCPDRFRVEVEGTEHMPAEAGRGILFVTAHIGQWELSSHLASHGLGRPVHVVREEELDPESQRFLEELLRERSEGVTTHFASDDPRLGLALAEALRRGEIVALQGDRPRAGGRTHVARLFDRPLALPVGPAALARATGAALLPVFSFREDRYTFRLLVRPEIRVARTTDRDADVAGATDALASEIEWAIRRAPHQWFCFRPLWD